MPLGILAANSGIYLSTNGGSPSGLVEKFGTDGTYISTIGSIGSGVGQYKAPYGLASDSAGDIYVADFLNNRIVEFNKTGVFVQTIGSSGSGDGNLNGPNGVAVDSQNNIFVADSLNYRIEEFNLSGIFVRTIGSFGVQDRGICVDAADNVYVTTDGGTCYKYSNNGTLLGTFGTPGTGAGKLKMPVGIGVDPVTNDIFVADQYNNSIVRYNLSFGVKTTYMVYSAPFDLSLNGGTLWLANTDGAGFGQKDVISMIY
jgi:DNA-binding beta-propeller fold protein YncE